MINIQQKSCPYIFFAFFFIAAIVIVSGCQGDRVRTPNIDHIEANLEVKRFDLDFAAVDTLSLEEDIQRLQADYPTFFDVYFMQIMADRPLRASEMLPFAAEIIREEYIKDLQDTIALYFPDLTPQIREIEEALRYYRYYFEDEAPKTLVTFISEYGIGACTVGDDTLGIGLDLYLGEDYVEYDPSVFPSFIRQSMTRDYMVVHMVKALIKNHLPPPTNNRMLDIMIHNGTMLYLTSLILPHHPRHMIMEYTPTDMGWVEQNELQIWSHFLSSDLLYSSSKRDIQKLIGPSPNAPGMPPEAPGETANFIGMQIIKSYMKRFPDTTIQDLLDMDDAQEVLEKSRYRP